jgi:uncharacterized protein
MLLPGGRDAGFSPPLVDLRICAADAVLALNNANSIETSTLDAASYTRLLSAAGLAIAVGQEPAAFLIAFNDASVHDNDNLAWFQARHDRFYYVDRIIVSASARGRGLARVLYQALFASAQRENRPLIGCEINVEPPNPASDALHAALGFAEIARRDLQDGKIIRYMSLTLP